MLSLESNRGQNEVLGAVFVFALILLGISVVLATGGEALGGSNQAVVESQVQESLVKLASEGDAVVGGDASTKQSDLNLNLDGQTEAVQVDEDAGSIHVEVAGSTVHDSSLGAVKYENEDTTIAYQSGGVWRADGDGASMLSGPGVTERGTSSGTLTFPIVQLTGSTSLGDRTVVSRESSTKLYPSVFVEGSETVDIRIESQFATAWAEYFVSTVGLPEDDVVVSNDGTVVEIEYASSGEAYLHMTHHELRISTS